MSALGKVWHREHLVCSACKQPLDMSGFVKHRGRLYHEACYQQRFAPRCAACGEKISGNVLKALGKSWHPEHFVCTRCGRQLSGAFCEHEGKPYCEEDYYALFGPRCAVCGEPMRGPHLLNPWGERFCAHHQGQVPECYSCGRLVSERLTGGYVRYEDGRVLCNLCRPTAVDDTREAQRIMSAVRHTLEQEGLDLADVHFPLRLTDQRELDQLAGRSGRKHPAGITQTQVTTRGNRTVRREILEILALKGLPREHLASVLAHELGHAYLFLRDFPVTPPKVAEGICELCSYLWLQTRTNEHAAHRLRLLETNQDRVYGTGFRSARRALRKHSLAGLLAFVKQHGRFPK